ncbi:MAG: IMP dehydrogenase [Candidatus Paceibacterota bacterium]
MAQFRKNLGITFDDVLLVPRKTHLSSRSKADLTTQLTPHIRLAMPIISANMDTVTESAMAIEMARAGGIGIIHRFLTIADQTREVERVKRFGSHRIDNPITAGPTEKLGEVLDALEEFQVTSVLVVDKDDKLLGLVTKRDTNFIINKNSRLKDIMTPVKKLITAAPNTTHRRAREIFKKRKLEKLPLVSQKGKLTGLITARDVLCAVNESQVTKDKNGRLRVGAAIGIGHEHMERTGKLIEAGCDVIVIDIAHGHSTHLVKALRRLKKTFPNAEFIAGNVATYEGVQDLISAGADAVKIGIGPGALCTTRLIAGAGVPQITAIQDAVRARGRRRTPIIADGGIRTSGDITKALAAGASTVMIGTYFAGCDESPALLFYKEGKKYKITRGMASLTANQDRHVKTNTVSKDLKTYTAEGVEAIVPYKGPVSDILTQLIGGIKSGLSYCGARSIQDLWKNAEFIRISSNALVESRPHDVKSL